MSNNFSTNSIVGEATSLVRAIIKYRANEDNGDALAAILQKIVHSCIKKEGYNVHTMHNDDKEELEQGLIVFALNKLHNRVILPEKLNEHELRYWNKKIYNFLTCAIKYELKERYRTKCRRAASLQRANIEIKLSGDFSKRESLAVDEQIDCPFSDLIANPLERSVATMLSQGYSRKDIALKLEIDYEKVKETVDNIKNILSSNI